MTIKIETTGKEMSSMGGLLIAKSLLEKAQLKGVLSPLLPKLMSGAARSWDKFQSLALGFIAGADCLDDMAVYSQDTGFLEITEGADYSPKAYGDFLRSFNNVQIRALRSGLIDFGFNLRCSCEEWNTITFDFDSTSNLQHGLKMEGVEENYKGLDCLDTFQVFDELGIQYWNEVRPGTTSSASGVGGVIHEILSRKPATKKFKDAKIFARGDSAFCCLEFFNACSAKGIHFVCTMRQNMFEPHLHKILHWMPTNRGKDQRPKFYDGRECDVGETFYRPENGAELLRIVALRAVKAGRESMLLKSAIDYDYYAWVGNIGEHLMSAEKLIRFYRKRGHAENFIRELKYGFDLKHYPCLKLDANKVYGLIAAFAFNITRLIALKDRPKHPQFAKALRNRLFHLPVQIVRHAREVVFRFCEQHFKEVQHWLNEISHLKFVSNEDPQSS